MGLSISRLHYDQLLEWARSAAQQECCGLILGNGGRVEKLLLAQNVAPQPKTHFEIDPATLIAAEKAARRGELPILGYFHSHPNGRAEPSATDAVMAAADNRIWLVATAQTITAWRASAEGVLHGRFNPVTLAVDGHAQG